MKATRLPGLTRLNLRLPILLLLLALASPSVGERADSTWTGRWIWQSGKQNEKNYYLAFRRTFTLTAIPKTAPARITADSRYKLWVNGRFVSRGPARSDPAWLYYDKIDLTPYLRKGANLISALVWHQDPSFQYVPAPAGFLFETRIGAVTIASDSSWKVRRADEYRQDLPKMALQLPAMVEFDARREPMGWNATAQGFDESSWEAAAILGPAGMPPHVNVVPRDIPFLRETTVKPNRMIAHYWIQDGTSAEPMPPWLRIPREELKPLGQGGIIDPSSQNLLILPSERIAVLLDMGREMLGFPRIDITAPAGTVIDLGYGELLENGRVNANRADVHYADRYICREGRQQFELFAPRAYRYVQIDFRAPTGGKVILHQFQQNYATYPVEYAGNFECSDDTLNAVWKLGRYTVQQCMEDGYTDCPWRERGQWWGDARAEAYTTYYAFGDARLIRKAILQIGQGQWPDGITPGVWPADFHTPLPDFCLIWVMTLDDYVRFTGDLSLARELYPKISKALHWFDKYRDLEGLLRNVPHWVFIDWAEIDKEGACTALNAFYVGALQAAARIATRLDNAQDAVDWLTRAHHQAEDVNARLWSDSEGAYIDSAHNDGKLSQVISEQANALCILYGIADSSKRERLLKRIGQGPARPTIGKAGDRDYEIRNTQYASLSTLNIRPPARIVRCGSPYFSFYWLWALNAAGHYQEAVDYIRSRWKVMLDAGATTAWEVWNPGASLCHGWSSGPTSLLPMYVLGVRPLSDGMRRILVAPNPSGLVWAKGTVPTPRGKISVSWRQSGSGLRVTVEAPMGTATEVVIPGNPRSVTYDGNELVTLRRDSEGAHVVIPGGRHVVEGRG